MGSARTFRDLIVWRKAVDLAKAVYEATRAMPETERFRLIAQMRRAAVSVPSNIAEGNARHTLKDYIHCLSVARGSLAELETQITIARELNMLNNPHPLVDLLSETDRLLQGLIRSLQEKRKRSTPS
jgi:four helix bundle protein